MTPPAAPSDRDARVPPLPPRGPDEPAAACQVCGTPAATPDSNLCRVCGEPVIAWGWAP